MWPLHLTNTTWHPVTSHQVGTAHRAIDKIVLKRDLHLLTLSPVPISHMACPPSRSLSGIFFEVDGTSALAVTSIYHCPRTAYMYMCYWLCHCFMATHLHRPLKKPRLASSRNPIGPLLMKGSFGRIFTSFGFTYFT